MYINLSPCVYVYFATSAWVQKHFQSGLNVHE